MFFSVPISKQVITKTPLGMRQVTHLFFENKNGGAFKYKREADNVTILIDGKMVCRQVPILPFMSSTTFGVNRYKWQDVALEIGLNVNMSEIKISADAVNDYNVVFVCSEEENHDYKGFDFVECKRFNMKELKFRTEALDLSYKLANKAKEEYEQTATPVEITYIGNQKITYPYVVEKRVRVNTFDLFANDMVGIYDTGHTLTEVEFVCLLGRRIYEDSKTEYNINWGEEYTIDFSKGVQKMFAMQIASRAQKLDEDIEQTMVDYPVSLSISGSGQEELPNNFDINVIQTTPNTAWRNVVHTFEDEMPKTLQVTFNNNGMDISKYSSSYPYTWDVYMIFIYKKIL